MGWVFSVSTSSSLLLAVRGRSPDASETCFARDLPHVTHRGIAGEALDWLGEIFVDCITAFEVDFTICVAVATIESWFLHRYRVFECC